MIADRTNQDVARWRELHDKGWAAMTAAEQAEWMGEMKGRYSHTDMNRVEKAVEAVSGLLMAEGYLDTPLVVKTDWDGESCPTRADMRRYLNNVAILRGVIPVYPSTPSAPSVSQKLDYSLANDIEQILIDLDNIIRGIPKARYYAGEVFAGEV